MTYICEEHFPSPLPSLPLIVCHDGIVITFNDAHTPFAGVCSRLSFISVESAPLCNWWSIPSLAPLMFLGSIHEARKRFPSCCERSSAKFVNVSSFGSLSPLMVSGELNGGLPIRPLGFDTCGQCRTQNYGGLCNSAVESSPVIARDVVELFPGGIVVGIPGRAVDVFLFNNDRILWGRQKANRLSSLVMPVTSFGAWNYTHNGRSFPDISKYMLYGIP